MSRWEDDSMYTIGLEADDYSKLEKKHEGALAEIEALKLKLHTSTKECEHLKRVNGRLTERLDVMQRQADDRIARKKRNATRNKREAEDTRRTREYDVINSRGGWDA